MNDFYKELIYDLRWGDFNEKYGTNLSLQQQYTILGFINKILIPKEEEKSKSLKRRKDNEQR